MDGRREVVRIEVAEGDVDLASDALWAGDPSAVSQAPAGPGRVLLTADPVRPEAISDRWPLTRVEVDDEHLDAWREWARPVRAGRVILQPSWLPEEPPAAGEVVVRLDPGRAFGSGSHPSTRLVVQAMQGRVEPGSTVLDVGCGSGVLSVAARVLGADSVLAIDSDPAAIEATRANTELNGVSDGTVVSGMPLGEVPGTFDVVVANIGVRVLTELAGELVSRTAAEGVLVLAGLLEDQADSVVAACAGLREVERLSEDGWVAPVLRRT